jgi:two-component system, OmpR family, sensor kinase
MGPANNRPFVPWRWALALVPVLLGALASIGLNLSGRAPLIFITIDLGTLLFVLGAAVSLVAFGIVAAQYLVAQARIAAEERAGRDRRLFLRRLDHEMKNPLTAILAGLANVGLSPAGDEEQPALDSVTAQVQRLRRLVTELRKLSDLETRALDREAVDMTLLLEEVFALAQSQPGAAERRLSLSIPRAPWPLPAVEGDRDLLFLAIYNPLDNALKFTRPGDTIELRATDNDRWVAVEIADTGPGIPENEIGQVWEELYRGEGARGVPGSGLGLALVRAIVTRHNGRATIRSRPGQGTLVGLQLPAGGR